MLTIKLTPEARAEMIGASEAGRDAARRDARAQYADAQRQLNAARNAMRRALDNVATTHAIDSASLRVALDHALEESENVRARIMQ